MVSKKELESKNKKLSYKSIKKPVLKRHVVKIRPKNEFEFDYEDFTKLGYDEQTVLFNAIKENFANLRDNAGLIAGARYQDLFYNNLTELLGLGVTGNVAAMDYLCYIYKKGVEHFLPINLTRAHEWGMIAIANGSKLSVDRMRLFLEPVYEYVVNSGIVEEMIKKNKLQEGEGIYYVASNFASMYIDRCKLDLLTMARKEPVATDENFKKYNFEACKIRDEILPELIKYFV
ncbi:MAG: hypothetical protein IJZ26_02005 [Clostridia bacterium]|nr:hypothetical protein [Clostridia bacterium]MBQ9786164.1 hypothetical protein [Clostridia bacterium]